MEMINHLQINNYKSIKQLTLDCNRINVLIGEPNVGKSNILEALDLGYLSWMLGQNESNQKAGKEVIDIKKYFRINEASDLFYNGDVLNEISISHPGFSYGTHLSFKNENNNLNRDLIKPSFFEVKAGSGSFTRFDKNFIPVNPVQFFSSPIDPFRFKENIEYHDEGNYMHMLMPPYGNNLFNVIKQNQNFLELIGTLLQDFGLEIVIDNVNDKILIQRRIRPGVIYSMKYEAIADTLRRIIFYIAAIRYNNGYVLTLEEPDAHSFPKFVSFFADEIIQNRSNQFFIATHNPYLLNNLIENTPANELGVFVCGFDKEKGTTARKLSQEDLSELLDYGVDIFFNINKYSDDRVEHNS